MTINSNTQAEATGRSSTTRRTSSTGGDAIPPALLPKIQQTGLADRFEKVPFTSMYYFFLNTTIPPFNNELARQAVNTAIDRPALQRLASGFLKADCYFIPEGMVGHPTAPCPYGPADGHGDIAKAQQMVQQSGTAGQSITVWGEQRAPRTQYVEYYADLLNKIGYKATPKLISDATYFPTIGNAKTNPQTGFADWVQDFPNPSDFYLLMNATSIQPVNNENFSEVNDPFIQQQLEKLQSGSGDQTRLGCESVAGARRVHGQEGIRGGLWVGAGAEVLRATGSTSTRRGPPPDLPERLEHLATQVGPDNRIRGQFGTCQGVPR